MTISIGELIDLLRAKATELEDHHLTGLKTPVDISWCTGDTMTSTGIIDVAIWTRLTAGAVSHSLVIRAHPHAEPDGPTIMRSPAADADQHLKLWSEQHDTDPG